MKWFLLALFLVPAIYVHFRGRVRYNPFRQLGDHSTIFAPLNLFMYAFSRVHAHPYLPASELAGMDKLRAHWKEIRDEALALRSAHEIKASNQYNDVGFNSFFRFGWKRFYLKWYGEPLASAQALCPKTVELLNAIPGIKAAMFATLAPNSKLNPHRDPFAGSLRYHLGLITPNSRDCRIFVDGEEHAWGDGKDVVFDETFVHWVENKTDQTRVILFADVERPLRTRWMSAINHRVGAFMGKITASPNSDTGTEKTGFVNRLYAWSQRKGAMHQWKAAFKRRHKKLYKAGKYVGILVLLWLIFLAPWPLLR